MYIGLVPPYRVPEGTQTFYNFVLGQILTPIIVMISTSAYRGWQSSVPGFAQSMARRGSLVPQALRQCLRETANLTSLYAAWVHSPAAGRNRPGLEVLTHQNCHGRTCRSWEWTVHVETLTIDDYSVADIGFHKGWFYNMPRSQHPVRFCTHNSDNDADRTDYFTFGTCARDNATTAQIMSITHFISKVSDEDSRQRLDIGLGWPQWLITKHLINVVYIKSIAKISWEGGKINYLQTSKMNHWTSVLLLDYNQWHVLTKVDEWLPDDVTFMLNHWHLAIRVDLLHVPVRFHLQVNIDLLEGNAFGIGNQASPLQTKTDQILTQYHQI